MSNRSAKFVPALFAGILAGASLAAVTDLRAQTTQAQTTQPQATQPPADNCLAAPKGKTPAGGHWYYRIDRATKRKCWYLREENDQANDKSAPTAPQDSPPATSAAAAEPAPPPTTTITRNAIADARAEWISQQARTEQNFPANVAPRTSDAVAAPPVQNGKPAPALNPLAPTPLAATRWLDTSGASSASNSASNPTDPRAAASDPPSDPPQPAEEVQQPAPALAATPSVEKPTASMQMLFLVMAAALALAGITVSLIVRFGRARARAVMRHNRRMMWDSAPTSAPISAPARRSPPLMPTREDTAMPRTAREETPMRHVLRAAPLREPRAPDDRQRQVTERQVTDRLARLARSAQT